MPDNKRIFTVFGDDTKVWTIEEWSKSGDAYMAANPKAAVFEEFAYSPEDVKEGDQWFQNGNEIDNPNYIVAKPSQVVPETEGLSEAKEKVNDLTQQAKQFRSDIRTKIDYALDPIGAALKAGQRITEQKPEAKAEQTESQFMQMNPEIQGSAPVMTVRSYDYWGNKRDADNARIKEIEEQLLSEPENAALSGELEALRASVDSNPRTVAEQEWEAQNTARGYEAALKAEKDAKAAYELKADAKHIELSRIPDWWSQEQKDAEIARIDAVYDPELETLKKAYSDARSAVDNSNFGKALRYYEEHKFDLQREDNAKLREKAGINMVSANKGLQSKYANPINDPGDSAGWMQIYEMLQGEDPAVDMENARMLEQFNAADNYVAKAERLLSEYSTAGEALKGLVLDQVEEWGSQSDTETYLEIAGIFVRLENALKKKDATLNDITEEDIENNLTLSEQALIRSFFLYCEAAELAEKKQTSWYKGARIAGEMVPFMLEFLVTGGVGTLAGKGATKGLAKAFASWIKKSAKKSAARAAKRYASRAIVGTTKFAVKGATMTALRPSAYEGVAEAMTRIKDDGTLAGAEEFVDAIWDNGIETWSEMLGEKFLGFTKWGTKALGNAKWVQGLADTRWAKWGKAIGEKAVMQKIGRGISISHKFLKPFGVQNSAVELLEEFAGAGMREAIYDPKALDHMFEGNNFESMLLGFSVMPFIGGTVGVGAVGYHNYKAAQLAENIRLSMMPMQSEAQVNHLFNRINSASSAAEMREVIEPVIEQLRENKASIDEIAAVVEYAQEVATSKTLLFVNQAEENGLAEEKRKEAETDYGEFWIKGKEESAQEAEVNEGVPAKELSEEEAEKKRKALDAARKVRIAKLNNGHMVFILSEKPNEAGEYGVIDMSNKRRFYIKESDIATKEDAKGKVVPIDKTWTMDQFLTTQVLKDRQDAEKARMQSERKAQVDALKQEVQADNKLNLGTEESPVWVPVQSISDNGVSYVDANGETLSLTWEQVGNALHKPITVLTDKQIAEQERQRLIDMDQKRMAKHGPRQAVREDLNSKERWEAKKKAKNIPKNPDGTVDETSFWNNDPEGYAEWNDELNQDGGKDTREQIAISLKELKKRRGELEKEANTSDPVKRKAAKIKMAEVAKRYATVAALELKYRLQPRIDAWDNAIGKGRIMRLYTLEELAQYGGREAVEQMSNPFQRVRGFARGSMGFVYMPNIRSVEEYDEVMQHEVLAHLGLKELLGEEQFNALLDEVWKMMPEDAKKRFSTYANVGSTQNEQERQRVAADEYIAHLAEKMDTSEFAPAEKTIWQKIVEFIKNIFRAKGVIVEGAEPAAIDAEEAETQEPAMLTDVQIEDYIRKSYKNLAENKGTPITAKVGFRKSAAEEASSAARQEYDALLSDLTPEEAKMVANNDLAAAQEAFNALAAKAPRVEPGESSKAFIERKRAYAEQLNAAKVEMDAKQALIDEIAAIEAENAPVLTEEEYLDENGFEVDEKNEDVRFSVRFIPTEEQRQSIINSIVKVTGRSEEEATRWLDSETSLAAMVNDDLQYLDYVADPKYKAIKDNSDYPQGTVDFNNICRKRVPFTRMFTRLQRRFPNRVFTADNLADIRTIMTKDGLTVACGLCYVEDRRQMVGEVAQSFIDNMQDGFKSYADNPTKARNAEKFRNAIGADTYVPQVYDLTTQEGLDKLYNEHRGVWEAFQAYNNARGQQSQNLLQGYAEYKREILGWSDKKVKSVNDNGGLRIFSYSDFEAHHLLDVVQIIIDCAAKGVKIQGYTKVPEFARAVANTGIKLNRSLIPLGDTGIVDGQLAFDPVEGIDVNDPNFLESNDNVGNILIGINDEQIRMAMKAPFVHYIIPYHARQKENIRQKLNVGAWTNYISTQNERNISDGKRVKDNINIYTDILNGEIANDRQFVEKYLELCAEKGRIPKFDQFLNKDAEGNYVYTPGYYKFLVDFKLFDENGNILPQQPVVAEFDDAFNMQILEDYVKGEKESTGDQMNETYDKIVDALGLDESAAEGEDVRFSVGPRESSMEEMDELFEKYNTNETAAAIYDKVSALAKTLDLKIRFEKAWSRAAGETFADKVKLNVDFMESPFNFDQQKAHAILHELIHSVTSYAMQTKKVGWLTPEMTEAITQIENIYEMVKADEDFKGMYAQRNASDMIAELHDAAFRNQLKEKNLFQKIVDAIKKLLGFEGSNALEDLDATFNYILDNFDYDAYSGFVRAAQKQDNYIRFSIANENQTIFVSNAAKAVEGIKQEKATPAQWLAMLEKNGGLKAAEDKWMGLGDWLKSSDKKTLTKAEVLDFINENMIVIEEQHYGEMDEETREFVTDNSIINMYGVSFRDSFNSAFVIEEDFRGEWYVDVQDYEEAVSLYNEHNEDKITIDPADIEYESREETLLKEWATSVLKNAEQNDGVKPINTTRKNYTTEGLDNLHEIALTVPTIEPWNEEDDTHFGDAGEGRAVAWVRFGETTDESGNRILVIDEIQSNRHQEGREKGYITEAQIAEGRARHESLRVAAKEANAKLYDFIGTLVEKYPNTEYSVESARGNLGRFTVEDRLKFSELVDAQRDSEYELRHYKAPTGIPDAPFDKNWHELAMKRMLRYAAENGYDYIAWTKGAQQAERYNIGNYVSSIEAQEEYDGNRDFGFYMGDSDEALIVTVDENGTVVSAEDHLSQAEGRPLADLVGKEMAVKMMQMEEYDVLEDTELNIGNKGMEGFYDKMLPAFMNKYGKKWGIKVEDINLPNLEDGLTMHSVPVTEEMKASVMEGQVMFSIGNNAETQAMNAKQTKVVGGLLSDEQLGLDEVRFSISKNNRATIDKWLGMRSDLSEAEKNAFMLYIDNREPVQQLAMARWFSKGAIRLPEDLTAIDNAFKFARKMNVDPMKYDTPAAVNKDYVDRFGEEKKEDSNRELLSPDDARFEGVLTNKVDYGNGIVVYDVQNDIEHGQRAVRDLMNDHLGADFNCWCLLYADSKGNPNKGSREMWWHYNKTQKKVAFKDGKICAFCASTGRSSEWWDLHDQSHGKRIPVEAEVEGDKLGRRAFCEFDGKNISPVKKAPMYRGNKKNGLYEEWDNSDPNSITLRTTRKGGKDNGTKEMWDGKGNLTFVGRFKNGNAIGEHTGYASNGQVISKRTYDKDGALDGEVLKYAPNGTLLSTGRFVHGKPVGKHLSYHENGRLMSEKDFQDGHKVGYETEYNKKGKLVSRKYHDMSVGEDGSTAILTHDNNPSGPIEKYDKFDAEGNLLERITIEEVKSWFKTRRFITISKDGVIVEYDSKLGITHYSDKAENVVLSNEYKNPKKKVLYYKGESFLFNRGKLNEDLVDEDSVGLIDEAKAKYNEIIQKQEARYEEMYGSIVSAINEHDSGVRFSVSITPEVRAEMDVIKATAFVDGKLGLAPNGMKSKLDDDQWALVRTKNFKNWFGDWENDPENASKVVDENGEPMVVYHGTGYEGNVFTSGFFASDEQFATDYGFAGNGFNSRVVSAFIKMANPRVVDADYANYDEIKVGGQTLSADDLVRETKKDGVYDGLIIKNVDERSTDGFNWTDDIIPFAPSQIKSATETTGEFSESDDIRFSAFRPVGGNRGYVGYSMSKRAAAARAEGRFPKTDFKKEYGVTDKALDLLVYCDIISGSEWHHTSMYGNKTTFYGWYEDEYADIYTANKKEVDAIAREYKKADEAYRNHGKELHERLVAGEITPQEQYELGQQFNSNHWKNVAEMQARIDAIFNPTEDGGDRESSEEKIRFSVVTDPALLEKLESEPTIKVYRAMQLIDGKLYPPMSAKVDGKMREPIELGKWEQAEERPDLIDKKGNFRLNKGGKGKTPVDAKYNPYFHTSTTPLNDQFSSAQSRPELVTVEVEVPASELTSGYKAQGAKDAVGKLEWKAGVVQGKLSGTREVILSRWDKPVRIVPDSEVAAEIVKMFDGKNITMPSNVVTPSLRAELEKLGVPFVETNNNGRLVKRPESGDTRFSMLPVEQEIKAVRGLSLLDDMGLSFIDEINMIRDAIKAETGLLKKLDKVANKTPLVQQQIENAKQRLEISHRQLEILQEVEDHLIDTTPIEPDLATALEDMEPHSIKEFLADFFTMRKTPVKVTKVKDKDGNEVTVKQGGKKNGVMLDPETLEKELGWSRSDWKGLSYIVSAKEGLSIDKIAEMIAEDENAKEFFSNMDTMQIKDEVIDFLQSIGSYADIRDYIKKERVRMAQEEADYANGRLEEMAEGFEQQNGMSVEEYNEMLIQEAKEAREKWLAEAENPEAFNNFVNESNADYGTETSGQEGSVEEGMENAEGEQYDSGSSSVLEDDEDLPEGDSRAVSRGDGSPEEGGDGRIDDSGTEAGDSEPAVVSEDVDTSRLTVEEVVNTGKQRALKENAEAANVFMKKLMLLNGAIGRVRSQLAAQREYDQETVKIITSLANNLLEDGRLSNMTRSEIKRLLSVIKDTVGKKDLSISVDRLMDIMISNQLRFGKSRFAEFMKIKGKKVDSRGVEVQGKLDLEGQRVMGAMKEGINLDAARLNDRIGEAEDKLFDESETVRRNAELDLAGYEMARQYLENIKESEAEEKDLRKELKNAKEAYDNGQMSAEQYREFVKSTYDAIRENRMQRVMAYENLLDGMAGVVAKSVTKAQQLREAEKQRIQQIQHFANSDMQGMPASAHKPKKGGFWNNPVVRFFLNPLTTFDQMLRQFGRKSPNGEGYLWNHFMRGWLTATENEYTGFTSAMKALDEKVSSVFGRKMRWSDLYSIDGKLPKGTVGMWDDGEMVDYEVTQGNLLYIYMVNKMTDGKMKLRKMGITEEDVDKIKDQMDPRFLQLADWLQGDFLPGLRDKYNAVHEEMFGAPMAAIDNYFPLKVLANARVREQDVNTPETDARPSTITGSIMKRTKNSLALDVLGSNAFDVVVEHLQQMEHWAAFAKYNRDLNTLLSYKKFRNRVQNMSGLYGTGTAVWDNFRKAAEIAVGAYKPATRGDMLDKAITNIAKGVTGAKISFRVYTAIKQLLSMPAFISDANVVELTKSLATPWVSWSWAMQNLPLFHKRWKSRMAGDSRLMETEADWKMWKNKIVELAGKYGMTPNAFIDALTVSIGAKAIYETRKKQYIGRGYSEEAADQRAKQDATILFNESQQSNEGAFLAPVQVDRTAAAIAFTIFRNSSMGYQRMFVDALRNLKHMLTDGHEQESVAFLAKQMIRDGVDNVDAIAAAQKMYNKALFKNAMRLATFGFVVQFAWNLGSYLPYLIVGDDDDEKDAMIKDAAVHGLLGGPIEGLAAGSIMSEMLNMLAKGETFEDYDPTLLPLMSDLKNLWKTLSKDKVAGATDMFNLIAQSVVGVNPQTITDVAVAIYDACHGDPETSKEVALLIMRILQCPQSQIEKVYLDEIDFTVDEALDLTIEQLAKRYAQYKVLRGAPLLGWTYGDDERNEKIGKLVDRFTQKAEELKRTRGNETAKAFYQYYDNEYEDVTKTLGEYAREIELASYRDQDEKKAALKDEFRLFRTTEDFYEYKQLKKYIDKYEDKRKQMKDAVDPEVRRKKEKEMYAARDAMVAMRKELKFLQPYIQKISMLESLIENAKDNPEAQQAYREEWERTVEEREKARQEYRARQEPSEE